MATGKTAETAHQARHQGNMQAKRRDADADVSALEREIDQLVYALYGLTPDEIKLIEDTR